MIESRYSSDQKDDPKKRNYDLAVKASAYARSRILKGVTQFENNSLSYAYARSLEKAVVDDCRPLYSEKNPLQLDSNKFIYEFVEAIEVTTKYSLGNCTERAYHAMNYFLTEVDDKNINVESYAIKGGDHQFIVIGRKPDSNPYIPEEWGDEAYICDPWSGEDQVYPAKDYLKKLKNYVPEFTPQQNESVDVFEEKSELYIRLENFNPLKHKLIPLPHFNVDYLRENMKVNILKENYIAKVKAIVSILHAYANKITCINDKLLKQYKYNPAYVFTMFKPTQLNTFIRQCELDILFTEIIKDSANYLTVRRQLMDSLNNILTNVIGMMEFSHSERMKIIELDLQTSNSILGFFIKRSHKIEDSFREALNCAKQDIRQVLDNVVPEKTAQSFLNASMRK